MSENGEKELTGARIRVLDPLVAQQVAAGEIVDRPASIVKELVENSLDAGAARIEIELGDGGTSSILVRDDGSGMSREDARLSVLRHATSKIRTAKDIESVVTLGFRGEALPSIASVSSFTLTTATGDGAGARVFVDGGADAEISPASHPKGTTILAERLFYNVPARRAFLKSTRSERAAVIETLTHMSAAHPEVAFRLSEAGRNYIYLPAASDLRERLAQLLGVAKARAMREVSYETGAFRVRGYAALPSLTESSRSRQTISVNGRWVRTEGLHRGLDEAYRQTVPSGRYPPVALSVEVDPRRVDVNVHPTKQIVRFSEERDARAAVAAAVRAAIERRPPPPAASLRRTQPGYTQEPFSTSSVPLPGYAGTRSVAENRPAYPARQDTPQARDLREAREKIEEASLPLSGNREIFEKTLENVTEEMPERGALPKPDDLRVIGQLAAGYILAEEPGSLWIVDQHVAHERAILDELTDAKNHAEGFSAQPLLIPEVVDLAPSDAEAAAESLDELAIYGFEAEPFGPTSFRLLGVTPTLADRDVAGAFRDAVAAIQGTGPGRSREDHILATIACHSAVKLGDRLPLPEMEALIKKWLTSRLPATCPHGRSICYRIGVNEVARKLDRH